MSDLWLEIAVVIIFLCWRFYDRYQNRKYAKQQSSKVQPQQQSAEQPVALNIQPRTPSEALLKECGPGEILSYRLYSCASTRILWENPATGEQRIPEDQTLEMTSDASFRAGGMEYANLKQLKHQALANDCWLDIYGREWMNLYEHYPCFDSSDYLCENRFYDWWFLQEGDRIIRVFDNGSGSLAVTEDVGRIERKWFEQIKAAGYLLLPESTNPEEK